MEILHFVDRILLLFHSMVCTQCLCFLYWHKDTRSLTRTNCHKSAAKFWRHLSTAVLVWFLHPSLLCHAHFCFHIHHPEQIQITSTQQRNPTSFAIFRFCLCLFGFFFFVFFFFFVWIHFPLARGCNATPPSPRHPYSQLEKGTFFRSLLISVK